MHPTRWLLLGALTLGLSAPSCTSEKPQAPVATATGAAKPPVETQAQPPKPSHEQITALCAGRTPCEVLQTWHAGLDEGKRDMLVLELALHDKGAEGHQNAFDDDCALFEYWLLRPTTDIAPILLVTTCNDGYGASGVGDDIVTVEDNRFTHVRNGGSAWRWGTERVLELSPLRLIKESHGSWWTLAPNEVQTTWDWLSLAGRTSWFVRDCDQDDSELEMGNTPNFAYEPIPQISIDDNFRAGGWRTTGLGTCSANVDSQGSKTAGVPYGKGFVTHGAPGSPSEAFFKVVMASPTELYVEIRDSAWVQEATSWVKADHLELWAGDKLPSSGTHCLDDLPSPVQWGITLDGKIHAAYGRPKENPTVERVLVQTGDGIEAIRFKIVLPRSYPSLTVVYSDTDDGQTQKRLIATSDLKFRNPRTLGAAHLIPDDRGRCQVRENSLRYVPAGALEPVAGQALLDAMD